MSKQIDSKDIPGPPFQCPECENYKAEDRRALGTHRRLAHGVFGTSPASVAWRERQAALKGATTDRATVRRRKRLNKLTTQGEQLESSYSNGNTRSRPEPTTGIFDKNEVTASQTLAYALGHVESFLSNLSRRSGVPETVLAEGLSDLLRHSASGALLGNSAEGDAEERLRKVSRRAA